MATPTSNSGRDHRDRWYASDARDHRSAEENDEQEEEQTIDVVGSKRRGHGSNDKDAAKFDEETAAAVARVEAKRKGVARVEAFLDMMTFKGGSDAAGDARNDVGSVSKMTTNDEAKNLSTATSSSQSPSPPTFSSSSPEDSMNSHALSKIMARPRPWKKRHRHFEIETSQSDGGGPTNNQAQALSQSRPAKREFETSRSPISHKLMRPSKDPTEKSSKSVSDEENTGTSFSSGSDSSISSNKSGAGGGGVGVGGVVGVGVGNGKAEKKSFD